jgi:hypothetical protein
MSRSLNLHPTVTAQSTFHHTSMTRVPLVLSSSLISHLSLHSLLPSPPRSLPQSLNPSITHDRTTIPSSFLLNIPLITHSTSTCQRLHPQLLPPRQSRCRDGPDSHTLARSTAMLYRMIFMACLSSNVPRPSASTFCPTTEEHWLVYLHTGSLWTGTSAQKHYGGSLATWALTTST